MLKELTNYPTDQPLFYDFLIKQGFTPSQLSYYVKSGWLEKEARGVYKRKNSLLATPLVIKAIQQQLSQPFIIGGKSALVLQGVTHFISFRQSYYVYFPIHYRLSNWLKSFDDIIFMKNNLFTDPLIEINTDAEGLKMSSRERAIIEMAKLVDEQLPYEEFIKTLEILPTLRSNSLQQLLESCNSVKAKRVFFHAADKTYHPWFENLRTTHINFGTGPRQIGKKGIYDAKYKIVVPKLYDGL